MIHFKSLNSFFMLPVTAMMMVLASTSCSDETPGTDADSEPDTVAWTTDEQLPLLSWHSIKLTESSLKNYTDLKNGGYTHSLSTIWDGEDPLTTFNANLLAIALDFAERAGVGVLAGCHELTTDPETTVRRFMNHPALHGWFLKDEPSMADFTKLGNLARRIKSIDNQHFVYVNLRPSDATPAALGTTSYTTYVNEYLRLIPVDFVSFDKYPCEVDADGNVFVLDYWYDNLQIIADASKRVGKDFWAFASAVKFEDIQAEPTLATLRLQMFTNLAYGAQGLQYFTYPSPRSPVYGYIKQLNEEIQNYAKVFLNVKVQSVTHTGTNIPENTVRFEEAPDVIKHLSTGPAGAVVSVMEKGDKMFLVVVSRDVNQVLPVTIDADPAVKKVTKNGTLVKLKGRMTENVTPGDMLVYTWSKN